MRIAPTVAISAILTVSGVQLSPASAQSATVCDGYARQYAEQASRQGQVVGGSVVGSLIGLGIGAATGGAGTGAAIGAGVGAIGGGAKRKQTAEKMYQAAYADCMAGRTR